MSKHKIQIKKKIDMIYNFTSAKIKSADQLNILTLNPGNSLEHKLF